MDDGKFIQRFIFIFPYLVFLKNHLMQVDFFCVYILFCILIVSPEPAYIVFFPAAFINVTNVNLWIFVTKRHVCYQ